MRDATIFDIQSIYQLYVKLSLEKHLLNNLDYQCFIQQRGFLRGSETLKTLTEKFHNAQHILVEQIQENIVGYVLVDNNYPLDSKPMWSDLEARKHIFAPGETIHFRIVVIDPDYARQGIATAFLNEITRRAIEENYRYMVCHVTLSPLTNISSILFHTKHGFRRVGIGVDNEKRTGYAYTIFFKELI